MEHDPYLGPFLIIMGAYLIGALLTYILLLNLIKRGYGNWVDSGVSPDGHYTNDYCRDYAENTLSMSLFWPVSLLMIGSTVLYRLFASMGESFLKKKSMQK